jgi:hypothetical protein
MPSGARFSAKKGLLFYAIFAKKVSTVVPCMVLVYSMIIGLLTTKFIISVC